MKCIISPRIIDNFLNLCIPYKFISALPDVFYEIAIDVIIEMVRGMAAGNLFEALFLFDS